MAGLDKTYSEPSYVEVAKGSEPKGKKSGIMIAVISIIIALLAAFLVYWFVPVVNNTVNMAIMKPEDYFARVHKDSMKTQAVEISNVYDEFISKLDYTKGYGLEGSFNFKFDEDYMTENGLGDLESFGASYDYSFKDDKAGYKIGLTLNDASIVTVNGAMDIKEENLFLQVPELTKSYLNITMEDAEIPEEESQQAKEVLGNLGEFVDQNPLTADNLEDLLNKYTDLLVSNTTNVELEKGVAGDSAGVAYEYNVLTATLSEKEFIEKLTGILEEAKTDTVIKDVLVKAKILTEDTYISEIDNLIKSLEDIVLEDEDTVTYKAYVDPTGTIRGISLKLNENGEDVLDFSVIAAKKDNQTGISYTFNSDTDVNMEIVINEDGKKYSVTAVLEEDGVAILDMEFTDIETVNEENGYSNGTIKATMNDGIQTFGFTANLSSDGTQQKVSYVFDGEDMNFGTMELTFKAKDAEDVSVPSDSDKIYSIDEIESYIEEIDIEKFINEIGDKIGVENLMETISSLYTVSPDYQLSTDDYIDDDYYYDDGAGDYIDDDYYYDDGADENFYSANLSALSVKIGGNEFLSTQAIGETINSFNLDIPEGTIITADNYEYFSSADGSISLMLENLQSADALPNECYPIGASVYDNADFDFKVNGIGLNSNIADIENTFGITVTDPEAYYIYITDEVDSWKEVSFGLDDGIVTSITIYW